MRAIGNKPRLFDQCGSFNPLHGEWDLDSETPLVRLDPLVFHEEARGRLSFPDGSPFCFVSKDGQPNRIETGRGEQVQIAILAPHLISSVKEGSNPVQLSEALTLFRMRGAQPVKTEISARVHVFRSGPPKPSVKIHALDAIDFAGELAVDHIVLGQILLEADQLVPVECRGKAQFAVSATTSFGEVLLPTSFRRHHRGTDVRDHGWLRADEAVLDWLEFDVVEAAFTISQLDFGIQYKDIRQLLRERRDAGHEAPPLSVDVKVELISPDGTVRPLQQAAYDISIAGFPSETVNFSGLCGSAPRRVALTQRHMQPTTYEFPPVRARHGRNPTSPLVAEPVELTISTDSDHLDVEITATLRSAHGEWAVRMDRQELSPGNNTVASKIPLERLLQQAAEQIDPSERLALEIEAQIHLPSGPLGGSPHIFTFQSEIEIEGELPHWLCCVDFGTSSTAIWIVNTMPLSQGYQLELGDWLARIDPLHSESTIWLNSKDQIRSSVTRKPLVSYLLPSEIGLSSDLHLRADFDPLSLGDLRLSLPGTEGVEARLAALKRTYDVSVPFPSTAQMADHAGAIVTELKKRMILRAEHIAVGADVSERDASGQITMVRRIDLAKLVEDCFDELGAYTALSVLSEEASKTSQSVASEIEQARFDGSSRFGAVITHPSGIDQARRNVYQRAGESFLRAFCGSDKARHGGVILAAESLAAARYGIEDFFARDKDAASVARNFVTLDIGAGTYDVTVIGYGGRDAERWRVLNHFGVTIGGNDLDQWLMKRIIGILQLASESRSVLDLFQINPVLLNEDDVNSVSDHPARQRLKMEFQGAKARLTGILLDSPRESYRWLRKDEGGPPLDIKIGEADGGSSSGEAIEWAVRPRRMNEVACEIMPGAELRFERSSGDVASVRLRLWREIFEQRGDFGEDGLEIIHEMMGGELPRLALGDLAAPHGKPTDVIVTGRAALWPLLYEKIEATVSRFHGVRATMARRRPFPPELMKQAVVRGAVDLTPELRNAEVEIENPIAILTFKVDVDATDATGPSRAIDKVMVLVDDRLRGDQMEGQRDDVVTNGPFVIARIIPGLDRMEGREERLKLFHDLYRICRIKPFVELTPVPSARRQVKWRVKWRRDSSGLRLTLDSGTEATIEFGPFGGGRVYGPQ